MNPELLDILKILYWLDVTKAISPNFLSTDVTKLESRLWDAVKGLLE